ncbi:response regulator [Actinoplanes sp. NPDC049599]|uniref:response regulator n=1 Tax=Actinoplanes sp. NPDC049599 TaxID=3363903 RepID=UPI0037B03370
MRLIVADDHPVFRAGLCALLTDLGHEVVATVGHGDAVRTLVARHRPDAVVLDIRMPPTYTDEGLRAAADVRRRHPAVAVLVLSEYAEPAYAQRLLDGERRAGYLLKQTVLDASVLDEALRRIGDGGVVVDPVLVGELVRTPGTALEGLTGRERDVLALLAQGYSDRGIAERMHIGMTTVATHTKSLFRKLDLPTDPGSNRRVSAALRYLGGAGR